MALDEKKLLGDFKIKGIQASEFDPVRGTMCTRDEFGGWGQNLSNKPYELNDGRNPIGSKSERMSYAEASAVKENGLCIHGNAPTECPYKGAYPVCRVRATDGKLDLF